VAIWHTLVTASTKVFP